MHLDDWENLCYTEMKTLFQAMCNSNFKEHIVHSTLPEQDKLCMQEIFARPNLALLVSLGHENTRKRHLSKFFKKVLYQDESDNYW